MRNDRWEHGSDFHRFFNASELASQASDAWGPELRWFGSGRDALRFLVRAGIARGWRRMLVPDFLCQEVVAALMGELAVAPYPDDPWRAAVFPEAGPGDVVLVVPYFGIRGPALPPGAVTCEVIEDHTHDPWSTWAQQSRADFSVASLRKTLPVPEGGIVWSPKGHPLEAAPAVSAERALAAAHKRDAMTLKAAYLEGAGIAKETYRHLAVHGESKIASGDISGITEITRAEVRVLPTEAWQTRRRANHATLAAALGGLDWLDIAPALDGATPFALIALVDDPTRRDKIRRALVEQRIYPPILWPLEETVIDVRPAARELSRRMLVLHCDARYGIEALDRVAAAVRTAGAA